MPPTQRFAITNVHIFDGHTISPRPKTVLINGEKIEAIIDTDSATAPSEGQQQGNDEMIMIDGQNGILLPGLIDSHVHIKQPSSVRRLTEWGVTTALDMASWAAGRLALDPGVRGREQPRRSENRWCPCHRAGESAQPDAARAAGGCAADGPGRSRKLCGEQSRLRRSRLYQADCGRACRTQSGDAERARRRGPIATGSWPSCMRLSTQRQSWQ